MNLHNTQEIIKSIDFTISFTGVNEIDVNTFSSLLADSLGDYLHV